jgi:hypothetical protein
VAGANRRCRGQYERAGKGNPDDVAAKVRADGGISDAQMVGDTEAAVKLVRAQSNHNGKVGVFGSCSGGWHAFIYARQRKDVDAWKPNKDLCAEIHSRPPLVQYPKNFGQPSRLPAVNHLWTILASMGTRPDTPERALRRRHDALLTIWLAFLDELDNPVHPCAAECRQEQRLLRDTSTRGLSQVRAVNCSLVVHSAKRP